MLQRLAAAYWAAYTTAIRVWIENNPPDMESLENEMRVLGEQKAAEDIAAATTQ